MYIIYNPKPILKTKIYIVKGVTNLYTVITYN